MALQPAEKRLLSEARGDARYLPSAAADDFVRVDETVPTYLAADATVLAALKTKHSPSPTKPVRAYDQAAKRFKICLGDDWLNESDVLIVDGVAYQTAGTIEITPVDITTASEGGFVSGLIPVEVPAPPTGYSYIIVPTQMTAARDAVLVASSSPTPTRLRFRLRHVASRAAGTWYGPVYARWMLVANGQTSISLPVETA